MPAATVICQFGVCQFGVCQFGVGIRTKVDSAEIVAPEGNTVFDPAPVRDVEVAFFDPTQLDRTHDTTSLVVSTDARKTYLGRHPSG
jgi:hypothetical protein